MMVDYTLMILQGAPIGERGFQQAYDVVLERAQELPKGCTVYLFPDPGVLEEHMLGAECALAISGFDVVPMEPDPSRLSAYRPRDDRPKSKLSDVSPRFAALLPA